LVIIIDEVGKDIPFAFGHVDVGQEIINDIIQKKKAKRALLVLVGAGLDMISNQDGSTTQQRLGTDPRKPRMVLMQPPQKDKLEGLGIRAEELEGGTYSRVLSDNPRMLMKGIVPIFRNQCLSERYRGEKGNAKKTSHRILAGSSPSLMNFVSRVYVQLNGLQQFEEEDCAQLFKDLFQFLLQKELSSLGENSVWASQIEMMRNSLPKRPRYENEVLYTLGLATLDQRESNAMRYLACDGEALPVVAGDGILFEEVVCIHLERFYSLRHDHTVLHPKLYCAWPPNASKKVYDTFNKKTCTFPDYPTDDIHYQAHIDKLCKLLNKEYTTNECATLHVVMKQCVSNAQGPDIFVLTFGKEETAHLDVYQVKNRANLPSESELTDWLCSLGVYKTTFDSQGKSAARNHFNAPDGIDQTERKLASHVKGERKAAIASEEAKSAKQKAAHAAKARKRAAYSLQGIKSFAKHLSDSLKKKVEIRNRYLVIKQTGKVVAASTLMQDLIKERIVHVWTREFLEPTFSTIPPMPENEARTTLRVVSRASNAVSLTGTSTS
jgi:hypothetical protein